MRSHCHRCSRRKMWRRFCGAAEQQERRMPGLLPTTSTAKYKGCKTTRNNSPKTFTTAWQNGLAPENFLVQVVAQSWSHAFPARSLVPVPEGEVRRAQNGFRMRAFMQVSRGFAS
jgi:hypothetical protein